MKRFQGIGSYGTVGLDFVAAVLVGFLGGRWLDGKLGTHGWLTIIGFVLGVAAGFNLLFQAARRLRKETEREEQEERSKLSGHRDDDDSSHGANPQS